MKKEIIIIVITTLISIIFIYIGIALIINSIHLTDIYFEPYFSNEIGSHRFLSKNLDYLKLFEYHVINLRTIGVITLCTGSLGLLINLLFINIKMIRK